MGVLRCLHAARINTLHFLNSPFIEGSSTVAARTTRGERATTNRALDCTFHKRNASCLSLKETKSGRANAPSRTANTSATCVSVFIERTGACATCFASYKIEMSWRVSTCYLRLPRHVAELHGLNIFSDATNTNVYILTKQSINAASSAVCLYSDSFVKCVLTKFKTPSIIEMAYRYCQWSIEEGYHHRTVC